MSDVTLFAKMNPFSKFSYWFVPVRRFEYAVYDINRVSVGTIKLDPKSSARSFYKNDGLSSVVDDELMFDNFMLFLNNRPEAKLADKADLSLSLEELRQRYIDLLIGTECIRVYLAGGDPDTSLTAAVKCIEWLSSTDFFEAPASTRYHESFRGGLLHHTLSVVNCSVGLLSTEIFRSVNLHEIVLCALVHDWCKIGRYDKYMKNVKKGSVWVQEEAFSYKDESFMCFGHGVSSMYLAIRFFPLTLPQSLAIRWHMGEYNVADNEMNELHQANEKYPIVQLLQFADRLSITSYVNLK